MHWGKRSASCSVQWTERPPQVPATCEQTNPAFTEPQIYSAECITPTMVNTDTLHFSRQKCTYRDPGWVPGSWVPQICGRHCSRCDSLTALWVLTQDLALDSLVPSANTTTAVHYASKWHIHINVMGTWTLYVETWWMRSYSNSHCIWNFQTWTQIINNTCGKQFDANIRLSTGILHLRLTQPETCSDKYFTFTEMDYLCLPKVVSLETAH
jgi:hypothetical protein